jgi:transposase
MTYVVGSDIAKDKFDVCVMDAQGTGHQTTLPNTPSGINKLHRWLKKQGAKNAHICLEATGVYGDALAESMHQRGYVVSVVNPVRIKAYAASQMRRNKTDALDAALIADYCRTQQPPDWTPPSPELKELRALVRHLDDLKQERQRARNRLEAQTDSSVVARQLRTQITFLDQQIDQTQHFIRQHINQFPDLKRQHDLLKSIPGIGDITACQLLAELGNMRRFNDVRQVVAYVGLNPRHHQSGKKHSTHGISRMGRASLRAALYMPAVVAKRYNPLLATFAERLKRNHLTGKQIIVAVMRKLIHLAYGILKSGQAFDPNYGQQMPVAA